MKKKILGTTVKFVIGIILVGGFTFTLYSLGWLNLSSPKETYGSIGSSDVQTVTMAQIREGLDTSDQIVMLEGRIVSECPQGTWFSLQCDNCEIQVKLDNASIVLPIRLNRQAKVYGVIRRVGKGFYLEGYQIEF
ncbi:MAG: hypothetical protein KA140_02365 [Caldisericia bacterium]|nr:hypothetical protein [Caldisericia bacterium]